MSSSLVKLSDVVRDSVKIVKAVAKQFKWFSKGLRSFHIKRTAINLYDYIEELNDPCKYFFLFSRLLMYDVLVLLRKQTLFYLSSTPLLIIVDWGTTVCSLPTRQIYMVGESGFNCWGVRGFAIVSFLLSVNVSGMRSYSAWLQKPFMVLDPWAIIHVGWPITCLVPLWWLPPVSLRGIGRPSLNPPLSLHSHFSVFFCLLFSLRNQASLIHSKIREILLI